jgi:hypothetical protein
MLGDASRLKREATQTQHSALNSGTQQ